jgi:lipopolysaccharide transport system permease protein
MEVKIINNKPSTIFAYLEKLLKNSYLITTLATREVKIKYSRTFLGIGWLFLQPLIVVTIYTVFFNKIVKLNTGDIPYPQFVLSGLILWYLFTGILSKCVNALIESEGLISKVSFPKIIILISKIIPVLIEGFALLIIALVFMLFNQNTIGVNTLFVFFYFIQTALLAFSIGMICSVVVLKYRDLAHAIPYLINFGIWLTPVFYSVSIVPQPYQNLVKYFNPLAMYLEGFRDALFYNASPSLTSFWLFVATFFVLLLCFYFFIFFEKKIIEFF